MRRPALAAALALRATAASAQTPPSSPATVVAVRPPTTTDTTSAPAPISVLAVLEGDYRYYDSEAEGFSGFTLRRARMGLHAQPLPWLELWFIGEYARSSVGILDAYATLRPHPDFEVNAGFLRLPTMPSGRDDRDVMQSIPEFSMVLNALWPNRDLGVEGHWFPRQLPIEAWARIGNGSGNPLGPESSVPTGSARVDLVLGRANVHASRDEKWGLRVGVAGIVNDVPDRVGIGGVTPLGFQFYRPPSIEGLRVTATAHVRAWAGPLQLSVEGGFARDGRSRDTDGNPATPREALDPVYTYGAVAELAWMISGHHRAPGVWPYYERNARTFGAWEVAARVERLTLADGAADVPSGGAWGAAAAVHWWANRWAALALAGYYQAYDHAPIEAPDTTHSWSLMLRGTLRVQ